MEQPKKTRYKVLKNILAKIAISIVLIGVVALYYAIVWEVCIHDNATDTYVTVKNLMK